MQQILSGTDPRVYVAVELAELEGKPVLVIRVPAGDGPHFAFGRAFHRVGPATVAMTRDEVERRLLDRLRESSGFERRTDEIYTSDEVDAEAVRRFTLLARDRLRDPIDPTAIDAVLAALRVGSRQRLNVAGTLLFARNPQGPLPQAVIRAHVDRGALTDARSFEGTLMAQIDEAVAFVARHLRQVPDRSATVRRDVPELPLEAVREALANAVAHRDYRSTAPIQLRLNDQQLEVWNPGHLPPPLTPVSLRSPHPSIPPNPLIARALFLAGYIEEWGTGTLRMVSAQREAGNPEPSFELTDGDGFRVVLPLPGALPASHPERVNWVLARATGEPFSARLYAAEAGISARTAATDLAQLEGLGLVQRIGVGRATRWVRR